MKTKTVPTYSFGADSPVKFQIPDDLAEKYNEATEEFFKAQRRFTQKFGRKWDPVTDPIEIKWSKAHKKAWADFAKVFDKVLAEQGPIHENDIMDDFLVKNVTQIVAAVANRWANIAGAAAVGGALYVLLRRR